MALITDLPAASSLAATDLLIKDTGSATQKLAISDAYASASQPGMVSTGAQTLAGGKTFTSTPTISASGNYAGLDFKKSADTSAGASITKVSATASNRLYFTEYHRSSDANTSYTDTYWLPASGTDSTNHSYEILTTKTFSTQTVIADAVTVAAGATSSASMSATRSGYTPIGIVGITGSNTTGFAISDFYIDNSNNVRLYFKNTTSNSQSVTWHARVLYI